jgi:excisionase family DNA binding protein
MTRPGHRVTRVGEQTRPDNGFLEPDANMSAVISPERLAYTIREAASLLGVSRHTVYRAVKAGKLPVISYTQDGTKHIPRQALDRLLNQSPSRKAR